MVAAVTALLQNLGQVLCPITNKRQKLNFLNGIHFSSRKHSKMSLRSQVGHRFFVIQGTYKNRNYSCTQCDNLTFVKRGYCAQEYPSFCLISCRIYIEFSSSRRKNNLVLNRFMQFIIQYWCN